MMAKNSFVLYTEYMKHFELLTLEQRGLLITAIMLYQSGAELPDMDPATRMAFSFISSAMDANNEKYTKTVEARKEAGRKSAEAKKAKSDFVEQKATKTTKAEFVESKSTKSTVYDTDTDTVSDTVSDTDTVSVKKNNNARAKHAHLSGKELESELAQEFEELWAMYPRKEGHEAAKKSYITARKSKVLPTSMDDVRRGLNAYCEKIKAEETEKRYIMQGSTFFRGRRWTDDFTITARAAPNKFSQGMETHDYDWDELERDLFA